MTSSVDSRISPKRYESLLSEIEEEDQNIKSELYELSVYDHILQISPGKTIQDEEIKDLVYCYVYAVKNDKVVQKLGVYERFTKEKEPFFDLSTFEKGTLCLFEKYETNPSLFLEFKSDPDAPKTVKKSKKKSKAEPETKEVDLNAPEAEKVEPEPEPETKEVEVDLNAPEAEPETKEEPEPEPETKAVEVDLNAPEAEPETKAVEVDLNAPESKPSTPALLDVSQLEGNLGITSESETKVDSEPKKSKIKMKPSKIETKAESKAEEKSVSKSKPRTKKTKPVETEVLGTKFG
uniref:Uncharacterized protein n=1 Tax=viral metagenome TaxID=1070528 RepID=A0A6C0HPI1_9ZZZZ